VQSPRLKLGLALVSLLVFVLLTPPNLSAAGHTGHKRVAAKKVSKETVKTKPAPKSTVNTKATGKARGVPPPKGTAGSSAKGNSKQSAGSASTKGSTKHASRRSARGSIRAASKADSKHSPKTVYKQQQPEPERIRDIQQALSDHGYPLDVSGAWDSSTVDALKKFQADQKIENLSGKGKLDSMTLIALGLGPKREPASGLNEEPRQTPEGKLP
jgi:hypothetical protein